MRDYSYQLFSSRNFPPLSGTLAMVADAGFTQVEGYGGLFDTDQGIADLEQGLQATGLRMPSAHIGFDLLETPERTLAVADRLGIKLIFAPYLDEADRPTDAAGWAAFGERLATLGRPLWKAGLSFGWHNHDFELMPVDGAAPLDLILAADPQLSLELDLAWVARAGADPLAWMTKHANRIKALHLKDLAPSGENLDEDGWADIGHGTMDWPAILGAAEQTDAEVLVVEHDNPSDDRRFATRSIATLAEL